MMALTLTLWISLAGAGVTALLGRGRPSVARVLALASAVGGLAAAIVGAWQLGVPPGLVTLTRVPWIPALGMSFTWRRTGVSLVLVILTGIAAVAGILFSWNVERRANEFFALYLMLIAGVYGVFMSFDLFQFFAFSTNWPSCAEVFSDRDLGFDAGRESGAMKLALYSFVGSAMVLVGMLALYVVAGLGTLDIIRLSGASSSGLSSLGFPAGRGGFCDSGRPLAFSHVGADRPCGGADGGVDAAGRRGDEARRLRRAARGAHAHARWGQDVGSGIGDSVGDRDCLRGPGGLGAADSSSSSATTSSHMGLVLLGLAAANPRGVAGAILGMFSHGIIAGLLAWWAGWCLTGPTPAN